MVNLPFEYITLVNHQEPRLCEPCGVQHPLFHFSNEDALVTETCKKHRMQTSTCNQYRNLQEPYDHQEAYKQIIDHERQALNDWADRLRRRSQVIISKATLGNWLRSVGRSLAMRLNVPVPCRVQPSSATSTPSRALAPQYTHSSSPTPYVAPQALMRAPLPRPLDHGSGQAVAKTIRSRPHESEPYDHHDPFNGSTMGAPSGGLSWRGEDIATNEGQDDSPRRSQTATRGNCRSHSGTNAHSRANDHAAPNRLISSTSHEDTSATIPGATAPSRTQPPLSATHDPTKQNDKDQQATTSPPPEVSEELLHPSGIAEHLLDDHIDNFRETKEAYRLVVEQDNIAIEAATGRTEEARKAVEAAQKVLEQANKAFDTHEQERLHRLAATSDKKRTYDDLVKAEEEYTEFITNRAREKSDRFATNWPNLPKVARASQESVRKDQEYRDSGIAHLKAEKLDRLKRLKEA